MSSAKIKRSNTYNEHVSVALIIQHAMHMCHIVICGLSGPSSFFHIISCHDLKKKIWTQNVYFNFLFYLWLKHFSF